MDLHLFIRRLVFGLLLVITLVAGWLLHGILLVTSNFTAESSHGVNYLLRPGNVPLSSQLGTSMNNGPVEDADNITPLAGMLALYQAASNPKQYWVVPNAGHAQSFANDPE